MKKMFLKIACTLTALLMVLFTASGSLPVPAAAAEAVDVASLVKDRDTNASWDASSVTAVDLSSVTESQLILSAAGDYLLTGAWQGQILIDAPEDAKVRLILNQVSITSPSGPAIYEKQADKLIVTLAADTVNSLTATSSITDQDDTIGAALYAEDDLSINGTGSLTAESTVAHGIQSKADLIIADGIITVSSAKDGIRGRNSVLILGGTLNIVSGGDGVAATRTDKEGKGWVILAGGEITIRTGDGAGEARAASGKDFGRGGRGGMDWNSQAQNTSGDSGSVSQKAVKAATDLTVLDGVFSFNSADDGLHAVNVTVSGGTLAILTGDDGMHADEQLTVSGGTVRIDQCYEGLEGSNITISGGDVSVTASDDAVNVSGGADSSGRNGWGFGADEFSAASGVLTISGGALNLTAGGDALDSNGSISITGGVIGIWCATTRGEGAIDYNGTGSISGGTLIIASTGGAPQELSGQPLMALSASCQAGVEITLTDGSGKALASFTPGQAFDTITVSSQELQEGDACAVLCGGAQAFAGSMLSNSSAYGMSFGGGDFGGGFGGGGRHGRGGR